MAIPARRPSVPVAREQVGTFPLLNPREIIMVFSELLQRDIDPLILTEPLDPLKIRELYQDIVLVALDLAPDQIDTPAKDAGGLLEYQQLHNQSVAEINLWRRLSGFVQKIGIASFSYRDLYAPTGKRTRRVLSGIINFLKYSEEQMAKHQHDSIEIDTLLDENDRIDEELEALREELARVKAEVSSEQEESEMLIAEVNAKKAQVMELNQKQAILNGVIKDKKSRNNILSNEISELKRQVLAADEDAKHWQNQIVKSPEKVKLALKDLEHQLEREKAEFNSQEKKYSQLELRMQAIQKIESELAKCLKLLQEAANVTTKTQNIKQRIKDQKKELEDAEQEKRELLAQKEHIDALIENVKNGIERQDQFHIPKIRKVEEALVTQREVLRQTEDLQVSVNAHIYQNEMEAKDLEARQERLIREFDMEMARMKETYEQLEGDIVRYHQKLLTLISNTTQPGH